MRYCIFSDNKCTRTHNCRIRALDYYSVCGVRGARGLCVCVTRVLYRFCFVNRMFATAASIKYTKSYESYRIYTCNDSYMKMKEKEREGERQTERKRERQ